MTTPRTDLVYSAEHQLPLDVYLPESPNGGCVVDLHGGGFFQGDKAKDADLGAIFAESGFVTVIPNYRLAPDAGFPAPIEDVSAAIDWVIARNLGSDVAIDGDRLAVFGSSAGGNLAIEMGLRRALPAVSWSGIIEIDTWLAEHPDVVARKSEGISGNDTSSSEIDQSGEDEPFYKWFLLNYLGDDPDAARAASPLRRVEEGAGPMLLINSLREFVPVNGILALQSELAKHGGEATARTIAGSRHAKGYRDDALDDTLAFLQRVIG
ncbi:alpha/beta hydrolase [Arthrobacter echini]|uniref:Alpha/beta hydrolase n=1 Tax=Arthrobacter echini TaxID=1529066 RepID=A0A4S5E5Z6_9MICC|nr:alpha/beta hydrolase [Arthrobacter echini]THJ66938.1 alpha/beta hydrolase [Arthrobacter echini]